MVKEFHSGQVALYIRVSTEDQAENGVSLDSQYQRLLQYCELRDLHPDHVFREEGVSAGKSLDQRPEGKQLIKLVRQRKIGHVVALKVDRLWRDAEDGLCTLKEWNRRGVSMHIVDMGGQAVDTGKAAGWYFFFQMLGFAEFERRQIGERTQAGLQHNKAQLKQYHNKPIYGYNLANGKLVPNKEEQKVIRRIQQLHKQGLSLAKIAEKLNAQGVQTKRGGKQWYASTVHRMLNNDLHTGNGSNKRG